MYGYLVALVLLILLLGGRAIGGFVIDYQWWKEVGQLPTWYSLLFYGIAPQLVSGLLGGVILWIALARGLKFGGLGFHVWPRLAALSAVAAAAVGIFVSSAIVDTSTVIRFAGSRDLVSEAASWRDPVFSRPLAFYLFDLPFLHILRSWFLTFSLLAVAVYWLSARAGQLRYHLDSLREGGEIDLRALRLEGGSGSRFLRIVGFLVLVAFAARFFLDRYALLTAEHGFLRGVDYVDDHFRLPLLWVLVAVSLIAAVAMLAGRWKALLLLPIAWLIYAVVPAAVAALYVRPNEINLERLYVDRHIQATRAAFALDYRSHETEFAARLEAPIAPDLHKPLLDNVRLWDWRAFHDTVTQIQALRPYYVFPDSDVDRYVIDGQLRQVLLTPRELDIRQLPDAQRRWINPHFIYTHGYGMVMAEANRITEDGLPHLFVQDAPAQVRTQSLRLTRPEIYYGESTHEPVFVRTEQREFSYPSGNDSVFTRYAGQGGFPIASFPLRLAAAVRHADFNILLTNQFSSDSRMMIRRRVLDRVNTLAEFVVWDEDPYLVVTDEGHLVWTVDGYTTSPLHPYSQAVSLGRERFNYVRNSVKATIDAYHGTVTLYLWDPRDPIIQAYARLFPGLFKQPSAMPANIRRHLRYPLTYFQLQAEMYRLYHMRDPQAFYNKEDVWDIARNLYGRESRPQTLPPTYVVATLPGKDTPEFLLLLPFTPRNKDNMIALMVARCDGDNLGELHFLQLSKQALIFGPMQIEARINQHPDISKDLTLWSQQGSQVLRGQILVLPVGDTFLYIEPLYIQAVEARMPQLKKVVLAYGNQMIYRNTWDEAVAELRDATGAAPAPAVRPPGEAAPPAPAADQRITEIRQRLRHYRELFSQGKYADAGRELEAIEALLGSR